MKLVKINVSVMVPLPQFTSLDRARAEMGEADALAHLNAGLAAAFTTSIRRHLRDKINEHGDGIIPDLHLMPIPPAKTK